MSFYVYEYRREDGTPYYVGKGKEDRLHYKMKNEVGMPTPDRRVIVLNNLSESEAFEWEKFFIGAYGRIDLGTGILRNKTNGGEGSSGPRSEQTKKKISEGLKGKRKTEEHKRKLGGPKPKELCERWSQQRRGKPNGTDGEKNGMFGKKWYNNGETNRPFIVGEQPDGWSLGRKLSKKEQ